MSDNTDANVRRDAVPQAGSLPFFARFLEGQGGDERGADSVLQSATERWQTLKYPSDRDEWEPFLDS